MEEIKRLLTEDAPFHVVRKIPDVELSVLHSACSLRQGAPKSIFPDLVKYLIQVSNEFYTKTELLNDQKRSRCRIKCVTFSLFLKAGCSKINFSRFGQISYPGMATLIYSRMLKYVAISI